METTTVERDRQTDSEDANGVENRKVAGILDSVFDGVSSVIDSLFGRKVAMARSGAGEAGGNGGAGAHAETKECPYCAETVKEAAVKCRYCGSDISDTVTE